jgi:hypothetical protein
MLNFTENFAKSLMLAGRMLVVEVMV